MNKVLTVMLAGGLVLLAVTFWGFTDKYSWINNDGDPDDPLLFDRTYLPKPAYQGALDGLAGRLPVRGDELVENGGLEAGTAGWDSNGGTLSAETTWIGAKASSNAATASKGCTGEYSGMNGAAL